MVHAETDSLLQILKQAQKMEELLKQVKQNSGLSVSHGGRDREGQRGHGPLYGSKTIISTPNIFSMAPSMQ